MSKAKLVIELDDKMQINVSGPLDQKMLCYGMLEMARETVQNFKIPDSKIIQPISVVPLKSIKE